MRTYVFDFSLSRPISPDVTFETFPRDQVNRLITKKTHYLDWMRIFWIGLMMMFAREGKLNASGRYRLVARFTKFGKYTCELQRMI